jgi:hypothetical protein
MYYTAYAKPKIITNKLMDKVVVFACDFLDLDVDLEIEFEGVENGGYVDFEEGEDIVVGINPDQSKNELIRTIFHEMVHVKQYVEGDLSHENSDNLWKGEVVDVPYMDRPWEKEAYEQEEAMWHIFSKEVGV